MPSMKPPLGLVYVPEERRIVQGLSVRQNLRLGLVASSSRLISPTASMCWIKAWWFYHAAVREFLADNEIKERYCSV
jgi:hypothetical protein